MAYVAPTTRTTNEVITAAVWNQDVVDNVKFLRDPPSCRVYNSANISIPNNVSTTLTFNSERWDTDAMHSTSTNTSRITFNTAGKYLVGANVRFDANGSGFRQMLLMLGGTTVVGVVDQAPSSSASGTIIAVETLYSFSAGQYLEVQVYQNSGGALNVTTQTAYSPEFWALWVSG